MTSPYSLLTSDDFAAAMFSLLPEGAALPPDPASTLSALIYGLADSKTALSQRAADLFERECDPSQAEEMLSDWEAAFGLPDPCTPLNPTVAQRQAALLARIRAQGGQSIDYYVSLAAALGFTVTITECRPFRIGQSAIGTPMRSSKWAFTWYVHALSTTVIPFRIGTSRIGEPLAVWGNAQLECTIKRYAPAHTIVLFSYGS